MNFTNIKTVNKIIAALAVLIVLLLAVLGYVFAQQIGLKNEKEQAVTNRDLALQVVGELRRSSDDITTAARLYVMTGDTRFEDDVNRMLAIRNGDMARPQNYSDVYWDFIFADGKLPRPDTTIYIPLIKLAVNAGFSDEELDLVVEAVRVSSREIGGLEVEAFNALKGKFKDANGDYGRISIPDQELAAELVFGERYLQRKADFMKPVSKLYQLVEKRTLGRILRLDAENVKLNTWVAGLAVAIFILSLVLGLFARRRSVIQLKERQAAQERAEHENEQLNDSVINILQAVNSLSEKDLTARAPVTEDIIGTVSDSINQLADETSTVLTGVTDVAGQVSQVSDNLNKQARQVSKTAQEERQSVQKMIETLFDATQTMNQVAALAEQSNQSADEATRVTDGALQTVNETVHGMETIRETISETEKRIKRLGERSQEISGIVNLINTISERTHVLALNASMQAAVAGEAGRGFAVVAEEVQQLAESSRNATEQIATLVNNIQIETNETINTVNRTIGQVVEGSEQAQQAGEQMRKTQEITAELVARVQNIADASVKQKSMSAQLLEAVQAIGESTDKTAEQIAAQSAGTAELQKAAKTLVDSVNVFTLPKRA